MIAYLSLIVSLFKLVIEGVKSGHDKANLEKKRDIQRKIIEIQLLLEDIIDNAQKILPIIKRKMATKKFSKEESEVLKALSYSQWRKLDLLLGHMDDPTSEELMRLFAPDTRRKIIELIFIKGGVIRELVFHLRHSEETQVLYASSVMYEWNHDRFLAEGSSYTNQILRPTKKKKISIFERIEEQEGIVSQLAECSKELSDFIKSHMDIEDVIFRKGKRD